MYEVKNREKENMLLYYSLSYWDSIEILLATQPDARHLRANSIIKELHLFES